MRKCRGSPQRRHSTTSRWLSLGGYVLQVHFAVDYCTIMLETASHVFFYVTLHEVCRLFRVAMFPNFRLRLQIPVSGCLAFPRGVRSVSLLFPWGDSSLCESMYNVQYPGVLGGIEDGRGPPCAGPRLLLLPFSRVENQSRDKSAVSSFCGHREPRRMLPHPKSGISVDAVVGSARMHALSPLQTT